MARAVIHLARKLNEPAADPAGFGSVISALGVRVRALGCASQPPLEVTATVTRAALQDLLGDLGDVAQQIADLLAALNTGHEGGCSTVHANSVLDVPARLEALGVTAGLGREAIRAQVLAGLRAVVHLQRSRDGRRRVVQVGVLQAEGDGLACPAALALDPAGRLRPGPAADELERLLYGRGS